MSKKNSKPTGPAVGTVRAASRDGSFSSHFSPGDIAVIDVADIDRSYAAYLVTLRPSLILNAKPCLTGRKPALGAGVLLEAQVPVVEDCGDDLQVLREGEQIEVLGASVLRDGDLIAEGRVLESAELGESAAESDLRTSGRLRAYSMASAELFEREQALIARGAELPDLKQMLEDKVAVVLSSTLTKAEMSAAKRVLATKSCALIAVGAQGIEACSKLRGRPDVIIGDPGPRGLRLAEKAKTLILVQRPDSSTPGAENLSTHSLAHRLVTSSLAEVDVALLLAYYSGASVILYSAAPAGINTLLDAGVAEFNGHLLVQAEVEDRLVSFTAWNALQKPLLAGWYLTLLVLVALAVLVAAILLTPWGQSMIDSFRAAPQLLTSFSLPLF